MGGGGGKDGGEGEGEDGGRMGRGREDANKAVKEEHALLI